MRAPDKKVGTFNEQSARAQVWRLFETVLDSVDPEKRKQLSDTVVRASLGQTSLADAWEACPGEYSRRELSRSLNLVDFGRLGVCTNDALWRLAKPRLPRRFALSIDLTDIPYHGTDASTSGHAVQGQAKDGTTWKHRYATAYVTHENHRYTLVANHVPHGEKPHQSLRRVIERVARLGLLDRIEVVLADKGFYAVDAVRCLDEHGLAFIIPAQYKATLIKKWCEGKTNGWRSFSMGNKWGNNVRVRIALVHVRDRGKKPPETFAYATGRRAGSAAAVHLAYLKRGGIETGYRLNNMTRARTTSQRVGTRVLYFAISMLIQNAWVRAREQNSQPGTTVLRFRVFIRRFIALLTPSGSGRPHGKAGT